MRTILGKTAAWAIGGEQLAGRHAGRSAAVLAAGLMLVAGTVVVAPVGPAHASCISPEGQVFWTWPAPGATDANPVEGLSVMALEGYGSAPVDDGDVGFEIRLNGEPMVMDPEEHIFGTFPLEPHTDYELVLQLIGAPEYRMTFRTGAPRPVPETLPTPVVASVEVRDLFETLEFDGMTQACLGVFLRTDCYDTGPRDTVRATMATGAGFPWPADALIYNTRQVANLPPMVHREETWLPGSLCQPMSTEMTEPGPACIEIRYRVPDGRYSAWSGPVCEGDGDTGCSVAPATPAGSWPVPAALAVAMAAVTRRRWR